MDLSLTAAKLFDIQGRNALITGGTSGIGLMMAKGLIANGVGTLYITGNEPPEVFDQRIRVLHSFAQEISSDCVIYGIGQVDLSRPDEIKKLSNFLHEQEDHLDILLSNAGIRRDPTIQVQSYSTASLDEIQESLLSHSHAAWGETFSVNSTAHFFLVAELLGLLGESAKLGDGRGCVVITSSCASMHNCTNVDLTSYAASKAATDHIVAMLAAKVGRFGIRVNGINPGCIPRSVSMLILVFDTAMNPINAEGNMFSNLFDKVPAKRAGVPEDIVATILYLASKAGAYVNGRSLCVDGGRVLVANGQE